MSDRFQQTTTRFAWSAAARCGRSGFTVIELLVVLAIIGILASLTLPALKGLGEGNVMASANQQILDAVSEARLLAIKERTKVFLVFAGPVDPGWSVPAAARPGLLVRQYKAYAMFAERTAGDQPGQHHPRYLKDWEELPDGILFAQWKFKNSPDFLPPNATAEDPSVLEFEYELFPYPDVGSSAQLLLPYIAFGPQGGVLSATAADGFVRIPLARGSYFLQRAPGTDDPVWAQATPREQPPANSVNNHNYIVVDALTGRARVDRPTIPTS